MKKFILTGFTPFGEVQINPSGAVVAALAQKGLDEFDLIAEVLPTAFDPAGGRIRALVREVKPDGVICLGVAQSRAEITPERFALNINDAAIADNDGLIASGRPIVPEGPVAYQSTLPVAALVTAITSLGIPAKASNHAGAYVCNHVFYCLMDELATGDLAIPAGFIHLPMASDFIGQPGAEQGLALAELIRAVEVCLTLLNGE